MNGRAPAIDADGRVLVMIGNGRADMSPTDRRNFGNSLVALDPISLSVVDFFTPDNHLHLNAADLDLGGSGPMVIPGFKLVVGGGKEGVMHVWRLDELGLYADGDPAVLQKFPAGDPVLWVWETGNDHPAGPLPEVSKHAGHIMGGPVYWDRSIEQGGPVLYNWSEGSELRAYAVDPSAKKPVTLPPIIGPDLQKGHPGGVLTLSANAFNSGTAIVWASTYEFPPDALNNIRPGYLTAYDAETLRRVWTSRANPGRDDLGGLAKFNPPTVANGRVYVATFSDQVVAYGLLKHRYRKAGIAVTNLILSRSTSN